MKHNKDCPLYKQEIKIMRNLAIKLRRKGPMGEYRTFSEARVKGRRLKFWGVKNPHYATVLQDEYYNQKLHQLYVECAAGLEVAGWKLDVRRFYSGSYYTRNLSLTITRIGS